MYKLRSFWHTLNSPEMAVKKTQIPDYSFACNTGSISSVRMCKYLGVELESSEDCLNPSICCFNCSKFVLIAEYLRNLIRPRNFQKMLATASLICCGHSVCIQNFQNPQSRLHKQRTHRVHYCLQSIPCIILFL